MLLHEIKVIAALAILAVAIAGGLIPLLVAREQGSRRFLSLGNALAGGIFLGAGFIHLLAESGETLEGLVDYPLAPLLAAGGVVLLLLIDRVLLDSPGAQRGAERGGIPTHLSPGPADRPVRAFGHRRHCPGHRV